MVMVVESLDGVSWRKIVWFKDNSNNIFNILMNNIIWIVGDDLIHYNNILNSYILFVS